MLTLMYPYCVSYRHLLQFGRVKRVDVFYSTGDPFKRTASFHHHNPRKNTQAPDGGAFLFKKRMVNWVNAKVNTSAFIMDSWIWEK